ncbi:DUF4430 domain-containing protein [Marine Group III euryarchaeote]|nr:DUF4430 domain-containing protein [Marine Group III euryarchaeote]
MNENVVQIGVALVIVNLVAWGGFTVLQDDDTKEYITEIVYQQEEVDIANVTVTIDYNGAEVNATANTNVTIVNYNVTVIDDNSAFNATLEAGKGNFQVTFSWHPSFGVFINEIDGIAGGCAYWQLLHNGESSSLGASSLLLAENDSITWKYNTDYC